MHFIILRVSSPCYLQVCCLVSKCLEIYLLFISSLVPCGQRFVCMISVVCVCDLRVYGFYSLKWLRYVS